MSRIGKSPITLPAGVKAELVEGAVTLNGPKGTLSVETPTGFKAQLDGSILTLTRPSDEQNDRALHGLTRSLVQNAVIGVSEGFSKKLEVIGVGFKVNASGQKLTLSLGFSHDVTYVVPDGVSASVEQNAITISGIDKQQVGQVAADIRALRKPEPYKGKGIRYADEYIIRKAGKAAAAGKE
jgi:large subunit ribosomal protein L6